MLRQFDRLQAGAPGGLHGGVVTAEQQHQGRRQLLGSPSGPLGFEGVPVAVADRQQPLQRHRLRQGSLGPAITGWGWLLRHWTFAGSGAHPDAHPALP